ncbi:type II toxin-antitoxin system HicA family toxin [Methylocaldum sp. MU1018]
MASACSAGDHEIQRASAVVAEAGCCVAPAKGSHWKVTLNGKMTIFPDHGPKEIPKPLMEAIKRDLGLK